MTAVKCIVLLLAMAVGGTHAQYTSSSVVVGDNTGYGGERFKEQVGIGLATDILLIANNFTDATLYAHQSPSDRKNVTAVLMVVDSNVDVNSYVDLDNNTIFLSSDYISRYQGVLVIEVIGIQFQSVVDIWQWDANGAAPEWWHGAVPSYFRLIVGYASSGFVPPASGHSWEQGADVTARFIEYLETVTPGFVGKLNAKIKTSWDIGYFKNITGKSVDELWKDYKAKYAK